MPATNKKGHVKSLSYIRIIVESLRKTVNIAGVIIIMGFNLKKILLALLFSTSEALSIKDVQGVISRYHSELESMRKKNSAEQDAKNDSRESPDDAPESQNEIAKQSEIDDIMSQVPTLLTATQIREAMEEIAGELEESGSVCRLFQSASGFKLVLAKEYSDWVRLLRNDPRPQKLSRAALETLAIVAYRQPVTRAEIEAIRGVNADSAITRLSERELIFISGRADLPGRPIQYSTTQNFLDFAGINSIDELPVSDVLSPGQISEWIKRASNPENINDSDVGLPKSSSNSELNLNLDGENLAKDDVLREDYVENPNSFPSSGAETAGSIEEFELSRDNQSGNDTNKAEI